MLGEIPEVIGKMGHGPWLHQQELQQASGNENLKLSQHWAAWKGTK